MKVFTLLLVAFLAGCATTQTTIHPKSYLAESMGSSMNRLDHQKANQVLEEGSEGKRVSWVSSSGNWLSVTPTKTFKLGAMDCRNFEAELIHYKKINGEACRREDGTWFLP